MRSRRGFLAGTAGAITALSGCLGYTAVEKSEVETMENRIGDLENRTEELNETAEQRAERVEELEARVEDAEGEAEGLREELEAERIGHVVALYETGAASYEYGNGAWSEGVDRAQAGQYSFASMKLGQAYSEYSGATDAFAKAEDSLGDLGPSDSLSSAHQMAEAMADASFDMQAAAVLYANGDTENGDIRWADGVEHQEGVGNVPDASAIRAEISD